MQQLTAAAPCVGQPGGHKPIHKQGELLCKYIQVLQQPGLIPACLLWAQLCFVVFRV
jgi:hypothetical protein